MDNHNESQKVQMLKDIKNAISHAMTMFSGYEQHVCKNLFLIFKKIVWNHSKRLYISKHFQKFIFSIIKMRIINYASSNDIKKIQASKNLIYN